MGVPPGGGRVDGVFMRPRRLDAVDVAVAFGRPSHAIDATAPLKASTTPDRAEEAQNTGSSSVSVNRCGSPPNKPSSSPSGRSGAAIMRALTRLALLLIADVCSATA
jgi:hypothetical protein